MLLKFSSDHNCLKYMLVIGKKKLKTLKYAEAA